MARGHFWLRFLLTLLIAAVLVAGGVLLYRAGYSTGYNAAVLAANAAGKNGTPLPYNSYFPYGLAYGFPFFFPPFGIFLGIGFFFLLIFLVSSLFRIWGWRRWGGYGRGPHPMWYRDWGDRPSGPGGNKPDTL